MSEANTNFHRFTKGSAFGDKYIYDRKFQEYRRKWETYPIDHVIGSFPIHLDIESTYRCNMRCPYCARAYDKWGAPSKTDMSMKMYEKIINEGAKEGLYSIKLSLRGEPLLHKELASMIACAKNNGILDVYFNTNGLLLNEETSKRLIDCGLDRISISIDGIDKEQYEIDRYPAKYINVVENVKEFKRIRDEVFGWEYPKIRVQTVLTPQVVNSLDEYIKFWSRIADEVAGIDMRNETPDAVHENIRADWSCPFLWQRMTVLCDGTIVPCLLHGISDFSKFSLGNVKDVSIKDAWHSFEMNHMRVLNQAHKGDKLRACRICSYRESELRKAGFL